MYEQILASSKLSPLSMAIAEAIAMDNHDASNETPK